MDSRSLGLLIVALGVGAVIVGLLVASGGLSWFGRLPGDIRYETERTRVFIPITSMILVSVLLTVVLSLIGRWR
ncbi:MAG TPA: DUF2905 domain-containing protein [Egibacteraceae bacterium]|jgi:uncharacterized membrane protein YidH (DUF202 family)|nr:DUF2905 domain-containing protein [Egibacteraceae bacterium]